MEKNSDVHLLYKELGETPKETILRFKKDNPEYIDEPMTYAGRLDPMAEGLLLVLSGEALKEKDKYLGLSKTYEFEMLWGFETDTLDVLGLLSADLSENAPDISELIKILKNLIGKFEQVYPAYSSKPVSGKALFQWAREGKLHEVEIPTHEVQIMKAEFLSRRIIASRDLLEDVSQKISLVSGDFRQQQILERWKKSLEQDQEFVIDKIVVTATSGFYVRQFVSDISKAFNQKALTFHIKRIKVGNFDIKDLA